MYAYFFLKYSQIDYNKLGEAYWAINISTIS